MNYIKGYDSLRAISISMVIYTHMGMYELLTSLTPISDRVWRIIAGDTGVQIFFTLSGFLITSILLSEKQIHGTIRFRNFYARRFLRLLPALIIFYAILVPLMYFKLVPSSFWGLIYAFFYVYNFVPNSYFTLELSHMWSLALEEQFYLTWPLIIYIFNQRKSLLIAALFIVVLCVVSYLVIQGTEIAATYRYNRWFIPGVGPIMIGSVFAILKHGNASIWKRYFQADRWMPILAFTLFLFPIYCPIIFVVLSPLFQAMGVGLLLTWIHFNQDNRIVGYLEFKLLRYIGRISYGLYVYQGIFLRTGPKGASLDIQTFPLNLFLTFVVAILSFELIEKRVLRLKRFFR